MTDELQGKVLSEVVCLRSKLYSIQFEGGVKQSAKEVQKSVKKTQITTFSQNVCWTKEKWNGSWQKNHRIVFSRVHKVALSSYDDKRYLLKDSIHSLAYGHYKIKGQPSSIG